MANAKKGNRAALEILVAKAKTGDRHAVGQLVLSVQDYLWGFLRRHVWDNEERKDVYQDTLLNMIRGLHSFNGTANFRTWLIAVACHAATHRAVRPWRVHEVPMGDDGAEGTPLHQANRNVSPDTQAYRGEVNSAVHTAFSRLPPEQAQALLLSAVDELDYASMTSVTGESESCLKMRVHRGRVNLKEFVRQLLDDDYSPALSY